VHIRRLYPYLSHATSANRSSIIIIIINLVPQPVWAHLGTSANNRKAANSPCSLPATDPISEIIGVAAVLHHPSLPLVLSSPFHTVVMENYKHPLYRNLQPAASPPAAEQQSVASPSSSNHSSSTSLPKKRAPVALACAPCQKRKSKVCFAPAES